MKVNPAGGESTWSVKANELFNALAVNKVLCAKVIIIPGKLPSVDLSFKVPDGNKTQEVGFAKYCLHIS